MLKDVAAAAGMSAAKAHRYLVSFQRLGLVTQDARTARYDLGPAALKLGLASLARLDAMRLARERVPAGWNRSATPGAGGVGQPWPHHRALGGIAQAVTANLRLGDVMPLLSSATGRCLLPTCRPKPWRPCCNKSWPRPPSCGAPTCPPRWNRRRMCWPMCAERGMARWWTRCCPASSRLRPGV